MIPRRSFLAMLAAPRQRRAFGILCQLGSKEASARRALDAARAAGFPHCMVNFAWDQVDAAFLKGLPAWLRDSGLQCDSLGAYVNCTAPDAVIMNTRAADFLRALDYAAELNTRRLVAWTGSHLPDLMKPDPRNFTPAAEDAILRFLEPHLRKLESARLTLALETYITLTCPDAPSLARLLKRLPRSVGAVMDPPNLTPISRYSHRDDEMRAMFQALHGRIAVVHMKDFRLAPNGQSYELPGPLAGEMNYRLYADLIRSLPEDIPVAAEHISPAQYQTTREKLLPLF